MSVNASETTQPSLFSPKPGRNYSSVAAPSCLEVDFPIELVSLVAEKESWRKEIHRPATHTHKWWAQRLGSVFRSILLGAVTSDAGEMTSALNGPSSMHDLVVFDPFAGSGTTLVESGKLGARSIGRDINPVATLVQRQAVAPWDFGELEILFKQVEHDCRDDILDLYRSVDGDTVLYYFWVALAPCPDCEREVELFSDLVFARHAYASRNPVAHTLCTSCQSIVRVDLSAMSDARCGGCSQRVNRKGAVSGQWMTCDAGHRNRIVDALAGNRPSYRLYAKLVANATGDKKYLPIDDHDRELFERSARQLRAESQDLVLPTGSLETGYNTRQAMRWGFAEWRQLFNDRQLYCLGRLGRSIRELTPAGAEREALIALFSGTLEFNNLFCSYKGEGTGAVRHIFSHHILKPERTPLEANPWGTPLSSGSFSTLLDRRLRRAHTYKSDPHDLTLDSTEPRRVFGISQAIGEEIGTSYEMFDERRLGVYISTGDSASMDLPDSSVDLVITDPPFMDNVHYSELADFFHAWLRSLDPFAGYPSAGTTRSSAEVQSTSPASFGHAITRVLREGHRVLKDDGLLAFTFHQARVEGWRELVNALREAGFVVTSLQPVKAEMSVSATKAGAAQPSNLDSIVVCRRGAVPGAALPTVESASQTATERLRRLIEVGIGVSRTDVGSVITGTVLALHTVGCDETLDELEAAAAEASSRACDVLGLTAGPSS